MATRPPPLVPTTGARHRGGAPRRNWLGLRVGALSTSTSFSGARAPMLPISGISLFVLYVAMLHRACRVNGATRGRRERSHSGPKGHEGTPITGGLYCARASPLQRAVPPFGSEKGPSMALRRFWGPNFAFGGELAVRPSHPSPGRRRAVLRAARGARAALLQRTTA